MNWFKRLLFAALAACMLAVPAEATVKNASGKSWHILTSVDGQLWSNYPNGDKPSGFQTAPTLLFTDINSGSTTNGEGGNGAYMRFYGYSFGKESVMGTASGVRAYICNQEVVSYRRLRTAPTYARNQIVELTVQVGSLAGTAAGTSCDVKVTVNGVDSNTITGGFVVQPGHFWFVSLTGNDTTGVVDDPTHPFRNLQSYSGSTPSGPWAATTAHGDAGMAAGDTFVIRGGDYTDQAGFESKWMRFKSHSGSVPTGAAGHGYIHFTAYPGEDAHWTGASASAGGLTGAGTVNATAGAGQYWSVSGLRLDQVSNAVSDAAPINLQNNAIGARIVGNKIGPWPNDGVVDSKAGGIAGNGDSMFVAGNYVHDIAGLPSTLQNHGIYISEGNVNGCTKNPEVSYNWIENTTGGSNLQFNNSVASDTFTGAKVHHNFLDGAAKNNIVGGTSFKSGDFWDNIGLNAGTNCFRVVNIDATPAINVANNTCYEATSNAYGMFNIDDSATHNSGTIKMRHNILVAKAGGGVAAYVTCNGTACTLDENLFYDESSGLTAPAADTHKVTTNPLFTNVTLKDFTVATSSPALGACTIANDIAVPTDFYGIARPVPGTGAPGATKNDIGAGQGVGQ